MELTKQLRKKIKQICVYSPHPRGRRLGRVHEAINERSFLDHQIKVCAQNGKIGVVRSGMDCDCTSFRYETIRPVRSLFQEQRYVDQEYESAEGPLSIEFTHPSKIDKENNYSRDLALEAFEDGHPHVVYY